MGFVLCVLVVLCLHLFIKAEHLRELVFFDDVTGLLNKRGFLHEAGTFMANLKRHKVRSISIVYIDLKGFGAINKRIGHRYGDDALRAFGSFLRTHVRKGDIAARLHGDEFVILFVELTEQEVNFALSRLRNDFAKYGTQIGIPELSFRYGSVRASCDNTKTPEELIHDADEDMIKRRVVQ